MVGGDKVSEVRLSGTPIPFLPTSQKTFLENANWCIVACLFSAMFQGEIYNSSYWLPDFDLDQNFIFSRAVFNTSSQNVEGTLIKPKDFLSEMLAKSKKKLNFCLLRLF
jgi:hypothetical protein